MADIFLSYAQADREQAREIATALIARGWEVWWDVTLSPGTHFRDKIAEQLEAARCVVVLWSRASIKSDWVIDEADDGKRRRILIQALIENVLPPHGFRQIQTATLIQWDGRDSREFARFCEGISAYAP
jgi:TIR domain